MSRVVYEDPIHHISGKISKKFRTGYAYRKLTNNNGENKAYTYVRGARLSQPSADELAARARFGAVATAVKERKMDPLLKRTDGEAFRAQSTYHTMQAYLWHVCGEEYDASLENAED